MSCDCDDELGADDKDPEPKRPRVVADCDDPNWKPTGGMTRAKCREMAALAHCATYPTDPWCAWYGRKRRREKRDRTISALALAGFVWLLWRD